MLLTRCMCNPEQVETPGKTLGYWHEIKIHPSRYALRPTCVYPTVGVNCPFQALSESPAIAQAAVDPGQGAATGVRAVGCEHQPLVCLRPVPHPGAPAIFPHPRSLCAPVHATNVPWHSQSRCDLSPWRRGTQASWLDVCSSSAFARGDVRSSPTGHACAPAQDFGHSWVNLTANSDGAVASFWDFDWGATLHRGDKRAFVDETILATVYESPAAMKGPYPGWDRDIHFVASHDFFKSAHSKLVSCGNQFELIGQKVRAGRRACSCCIGKL